MSKTVYDLVNATIKKVERVEDYFQLVMDSQVMNIFNPVTCYSSNKTNKVELSSAIKKKIVYIEYEERSFLKIHLEDQTFIKVSLLEEDYTGPEAISVHYDSGEVIVFE